MVDRHDVIIVCDRHPEPIELQRFEVGRRRVDDDGDQVIELVSRPGARQAGRWQEVGDADADHAVQLQLGSLTPAGQYRRDRIRLVCPVCADSLTVRGERMRRLVLTAAAGGATSLNFRQVRHILS